MEDQKGGMLMRGCGTLFKYNKCGLPNYGYALKSKQHIPKDMFAHSWYRDKELIVFNVEEHLDSEC